MSKQFIKNVLGWGVLLWLFGYVLGITLFFAVPINLIGWIILPAGTAVTLWVLFKKIDGKSLRHYLSIAFSWTLIAVLSDYLFIVKMLNPADGYYKTDVYIYYMLTFLLPLFAYSYRRKRG